MSILRSVRRVEDRQDDDTELWMLPFSTLMLTLVILFIFFYAFSAYNSMEFEAAVGSLASEGTGEQVKREISLARSMQEFISAKGMGDRAQLDVTARFIRLKMESPVLFDSGSAVLKPDGAPILDRLAGEVKDMNNRIIVEGHTDNVAIHSGPYGSNWELSAARAFSVIYFLIGNGIDRTRLVAHGYGEFRPAFKNDTEGGRARNRRIEITVVRGGSGT